MEWLSRNIGSAISAIVVIFGVIVAWVLGGADIKQLKRDRDKANQRANELSEQIHSLEMALSLHAADSTRHIDPARDKRIWDDFQDSVLKQFVALNARMDRVMVWQPPPPIAPP